jgi:RNA polymerase sigma-70 factor, ECF subfamily
MERRPTMIESEAAPSPVSEDRQLLARIAQQDRRAFEVLYRRYYRRVFHFVARLVRQEAAAEEVVSDVMFAVWQGAGSFEGASSVSTWILGIAYRQAMKLIEKNRKHSVVDSNDEALAATVDVDPHANPEHAAITDSYASLLQQGMDGLQEHHRVVVELTAMGHSYAEISQVVGCPENTVKTRMFHARLQLKRYLDTAHEHEMRRATDAGLPPAAGRTPATRTEFISIDGAPRRSGYRL